MRVSDLTIVAILFAALATGCSRNKEAQITETSSRPQSEDGGARPHVESEDFGPPVAMAPAAGGDAPGESPGDGIRTIEVGEKYAIANVFYGTDRRRTSETVLRKTFGSKRGEFELGICRVSIPYRRARGDLPRPWFDRFEDPEDHVVLLDIIKKSETEFLKEISTVIANSDDDSALVFVHGFNVTFAEAAYRAGQLAADLDFTGAVSFFSWPSNGGLFDYTSDTEDVQFAKPHIKAFLRLLATKTGAKRIHVIAHSMGTRGFTGAMADLMEELDESERGVFKQVILTASDIDAEVFRDQIAPKIVDRGPRVTIYASSVDWPLKYSSYDNENQRLGQCVNGVPFAVKGIESVDATSVITSFIGHSYLFDERKLINDLTFLLDDRPAEDRPGLRSKTIDGFRFWRME